MDAEAAPATKANVDLITRLVIPVILAVCIIAVWVGYISLQDQTKDLAQRLAAAEAAAGKSNDRLAALEKANADAETEKKALQARVAETAAAAAKSANSVAALTTTLNGAQAQSKTLSDTVSALAKASADADEKAKGLDGRLGAAETQSQALEARLASGEAQAKALGDRLSTAEALLADASAGVAKLTDFASSVNARTDAVSKAVAAASAAFSQANAALAGLETNVAKLTADESGVKSEVDSVRGAVAWRSLPAETLAALTKEAAKTADAKVDIAYLVGDTESHAFAMQIGKAFKAAGWDVGYSEANYPGSMITGVLVDTGDDPATAAVEAAFKTAGVDFLAAKLPDPEEVVGQGRREGAASVLIGSHAVRF